MLSEIMSGDESREFMKKVSGDTRGHTRKVADGKVVAKQWGGNDMYRTVEVHWTFTHEGTIHTIEQKSTAHWDDLVKWHPSEKAGPSKPAPKTKPKKKAKGKGPQPVVQVGAVSSDESEPDLRVEKAPRKRRRPGNTTPPKKGAGRTVRPDQDTDEDEPELLDGTTVDALAGSPDDIGTTDVEDYIDASDDSGSDSEAGTGEDYATDTAAPEIPGFLGDADFSDGGDLEPGQRQKETGAKPGPAFRQNAEPSNYLRLLLTFWSDEQVDKVIDQSHLYAKQEQAKSASNRGRPYTKLTKSRFWLYLALVMIMGVFPRSCKKDYFRTFNVGGVRYPSLSDHGMGLTEFEQITRYLHFNDNSKDPGTDKMYKVKPLVDDFNRWAARAYQMGKHICIDEAMFPFSGRAPCKQYLPLKPKKRGLKIWCLNDSVTGYFYHIKPYRGRHEAAERPEGYKVGEWAVMGLMLGVASLGQFAALRKGSILYTDRYFTTVSLARMLFSLGFLMVGTCTTKPKKKKKKKAEEEEEEEVEEEEVVGRTKEGTSSGFPSKHAFTHSTLRWKGEREWGQYQGKGEESEMVLTALCQQDTKPVGYISTAFGPGMATKQVKRKSKSDGNVVKYVASAISKFYNKMMGGVDLGDQYRAGRFAIRFFSRKWTTMFFWNIVQMILVNTYIIELHRNPELDHKEYVLDLVGNILEHVKTLEKQEGGKKRPRAPSKHDGRMEGRHFPEKIGDSPTKTFRVKEGTKAAALGRQCRVCKLQSVLTPSGRNVETTFQCGDGCMHRGEPVALCVDPCFRIWHTQHLDGENTKHTRKTSTKAVVIGGGSS
jgi:hypothetical protein